MTKKIAAITTVRNDKIFLRKWIEYYGNQFGRKNLYIVFDGQDQEPPEGSDDLNIIRLPHIPKKRVPAMRRRAKIMSYIAKALHHNFDIVIATDVDEFLIIDPKSSFSLPEYLSRVKKRTSISGLGLDVGQNLQHEGPIDPNLPFLSQRKFAHVSARYTKPSTSFKPIIWGSGIHRVKRRNFHIDPNLFHFHFGMVDYQLSTGKTTDPDRLKTGWKGHLERREKLFGIVTENQPVPGDTYFEEARQLQTRRRPWYSLNKPAMIKDDPVIIIPERFKGIV